MSGSTMESEKTCENNNNDETDFSMPVNVNINIKIDGVTLAVGAIPQYLVASGIFLSLISVAGSVLYYTFKSTRKQQSMDLSAVIKDLKSRGFIVIEKESEEANPS